MKATILLVDDDPDFLEMHRAVLRDKGYRVLAATSGAQCVKLAEAEPPDLIILDMIMEGRNSGMEVARALRSSERTARVPLIMVSSVNESVPSHIEPDAVSLPVNVFLEKPVDPELLLETVAGVLERRGGSQ